MKRELICGLNFLGTLVDPKRSGLRAKGATIRTLIVALMVCGWTLSFGCGGDDDNSGTSDACSSDSECKGDRICESGSCVSPGDDSGGNNSQNVNNTNSPQNNAQNNMPTTPTSDLGAQCRTGVSGECREVCLETTGANNEFGYCSVTCASDDACPTNGYICENVGGATSKYCVQGQRAATQPAGEPCDDGAQCEGNLCWGNPGDSVGYCTNACEDFTDCPTFWDCVEVDGVAVKICVQN